MFPLYPSTEWLVGLGVGEAPSKLTVLDDNTDMGMSIYSYRLNRPRYSP